MSRKVKLLTGTLIVVAAAVAGIVVLTSGQGSTTGSSRFGVATARAAEPIGHIGSGKAAEAIEKAGTRANTPLRSSIGRTMTRCRRRVIW